MSRRENITRIKVVYDALEEMAAEVVLSEAQPLPYMPTAHRARRGRQTMWTFW